jgi:hypothetical protein
LHTITETAENHAVLAYFSGENKTIEIHDNRRREVLSGTVADVFEASAVIGVFVVADRESRTVLFIQ